MEKSRICIYINNYGTTNMVMPSLIEANPGMGGTQYEMFLLCELFSKNNIPFTLLLTHKQQFSYEIKYEFVDNIESAFDYCNRNKSKYIILRANDGLKSIDKLKETKIIYWVHNFIDYKSATLIAKNSKVKKVVFVSQEAADFYYDHDISKKGAVIFNAIPSKRVINDKAKKENIVAFIGDLSPYKMFDKLTAIWPKIIKKNPDAKLLVLGSGDLYGKGKKFGAYRLAEEKFEVKFLKPILKNNLFGTVEFAGLVKGDMSQKISRAKVTVFMNPIETFCIAATDSIGNGVPVVCPKSTGYCDVVNKKTGFLFRSKFGAKRYINKILKNKDSLVINEESLGYFKSFQPDTFYDSWISLLNDLENDNHKKITHKKNYFVNNKLFVVIMRNIRLILHLPNCFSRIGIKWYIAKILKKN